MKNKRAIFDFYLGGHHIEYLHHIYMYAIEDIYTDYTFILPSNFDKFGLHLSWPKVTNIRLIFYELDDKYVRSLKSVEKAHILSRLIKKYADLTGIKDFVLIETQVFMPFLPLYVRNKVRITSILYYLPLYDIDTNIKNKVYNSLMFILLSIFSCFKRIFLLNSEEAAEFYNQKLLTKKFQYLPDPYVPIELDKENLIIKEKLGIASTQTVFIHFGGLTRRKGTIEILEALSLIDEYNLKNKSFVFAGRVIEDIRDEFYYRIEQLKNKVQIIVFDQFCEYSFFAEICSIANYILIPYYNTAQSSGVCSYAAQFKVPIIGPGNGLLGKIIQKNGLGYTMSSVTAETIAKTISNIDSLQINVDLQKADMYIKGNTPQIFADRLLNF